MWQTIIALLRKRRYCNFVHTHNYSLSDDNALRRAPTENIKLFFFVWPDPGGDLRDKTHAHLSEHTLVVYLLLLVVEISKPYIFVRRTLLRVRQQPNAIRRRTAKKWFEKKKCKKRGIRFSTRLIARQHCFGLFFYFHSNTQNIIIWIVSLWFYHNTKLVRRFETASKQLIMYKIESFDCYYFYNYIIFKHIILLHDRILFIL